MTRSLYLCSAASALVPGRLSFGIRDAAMLLKGLFGCDHSQLKAVQVSRENMTPLSCNLVEQAALMPWRSSRAHQEECRRSPLPGRATRMKS